MKDLDMQVQLSINIDDLKEILVSLINSTIFVNVRTKNGHTHEKLQIEGVDAELDLISFLAIQENKQTEISIYQIESVDFEHFFSYRGESARIFSIE